MPYAEEVDVASQSLLGMENQRENLQACVIAEAYAPDNAVQIIKKHHPDMVDAYNPGVDQRAIYQGDEKMIAVSGISKVLYDLAGDPTEQKPYQNPERIHDLSKILENYLELAMTRSAGSSHGKISLKDDVVQQRLRDLGYLE